MRLRVVLIALSGVLPLALFVQWSDMRVGGTMTAGPFPPLAACLQWTLLLVITSLIQRLFHIPPLLSKGELLLILAVWMTANMVAGRGLVHPLLTSLVGSTYYARGAMVKSELATNLPDWLAVTDKAAVRQFFEGSHFPVPWELWARPLFTWVLFFVPFLTANICLIALFERVWVRQERLSFPLVALPLSLWRQETPVEGKLFRVTLAFGMAVPLLLHGFGVIHAYLPGVPCIPFFNDVSDRVATPPWDSLRPLYINFYPLLVGLTFLAPTDVTFSLWFFLILNKIEMLTMAVMGWNDGASGNLTAMPPYVEEQSAGAFLALAIVLVWNARHHLREALVQRQERRTYQVFAVLFVVSIVGVLFWCVQTGLPLWFSMGFFGFYFAVALVLSRLMAEGGVSWILAPILPDKLILSLTGSNALNHLALSRLTLQVQHLRDTRQMLAPAVMQGGKVRDTVGASLGGFYGLVLVGVFLSIGIGVVSALQHFYWYGALTLAPNSDGLMMTANVIPTTAVNQVSMRFLTPTHPTPSAGVAVLAGMGITWGLSALRQRYIGWVLSPLGYALTGTLQVGYANKMLCSIFLGWAFKCLVLRFGGVQGFRILRGVALGLILGDLLLGGILKLLDALLGPSGYAIF